MTEQQRRLREKLLENHRWMIEHLSLAEKIGFISPVHIEIDEDHVIWTLTLYDGGRVVSTRLEDAVDVAVEHTNKKIDEDVLVETDKGD